MYAKLRLVLVLCVSVVSGVRALANAHELRAVPAAAPVGARIVIASADAGRAGRLSFSGTGAQRLDAPILSRGEAFIETVVPRGAASGAIRVEGSFGIRETAFNVAAASTWQTVTTIVAGETGHAPFHNPEGIAIDTRNGTLYIADTKHHQIATIDRQGHIALLAGSGQPGYADGAGAGARFKEPKAIAFDPQSNALYVADSGNHAIRKVTTAGLVSTVAGGNGPGDRDGVASAAQFKQPAGLAIGGDGSLYVADTMNHKIRRVGTDLTVSTIAGTGRDGFMDGSAIEARFASPEGIAVDDGGAVYVADTLNHRVRMIAGGVVSTIAGSGEAGARDGGPQQAMFRQPHGLAFDEGGNLIVADTGNDLIRSIAAETFLVRTITGILPANQKNVLVDGPVSAARFSSPIAVAIAGAIYVADTENDAVREVRQSFGFSTIDPTQGPVAGETTVRLFGTGFTARGITATIGDTAVDVAWISSTEVTASTPPHAAGTVDVTLRQGSFSATLPNAYTYGAPPTVIAVTPAKGASVGGDSVTIFGTNFITGSTQFLFGGVAATATSVTDAGTARVTTPAGSHGFVAVTARTDAGEGSLPNGYRFFGPPAISGFMPPKGAAGTQVVINGERFDDDANGNVVRFGASSALITAATSTSLVAVVPSNAVTAPISVSTVGGTAVSAMPFIVPVLTSIAVSAGATELSPAATLQLEATGTYSDAHTENLTSSASWATQNSSVANVDQHGLVTAVAPGTVIVTATSSGVTGTISITVKSPNSLPPDPASIAPANDPTVPTRFSNSYRFLYSGANAIQRDVTPGAIEDKRMAVVRGRVVDANGAAVPGARVTVHSGAKFGWTLTRADGMFDIVANGGGYVTVVVEKQGSITVHRRADAGWNDYVVLDDTVLIPYDPNASVVELNALSDVAVARGSVISDSAGQRQATLLFTPGTTATMRFPNGTQSPLSRITVRATDQTVGERGAMPAPLPFESAYTYCLELSADEAVAAGASSVEFSKPVALYVENFRQFSVGFAVPVGYYDRDKAAWVASDNGYVIKILSIQNGLAAVDTNGDGIADDDLTIPEEERRSIAALYSPGQTVWRVLIPHFTPWDSNAGVAPPFGAEAPGNPDPYAVTVLTDDPACQNGSIIECENLTLGKSIPIPGTPLSLEYRSRRTSGFSAARKARIVVSKPTVPAPLKRIDVQIQVAGRSWNLELPATPDQTYTFEWDGHDVMGRPVYGNVEARLNVGYVYPGVLGNSAPVARSFGLPTQGRISIGARAEVTWSQPAQKFTLRGFAPQQGIATGWTISGVDTIADGFLYEGNGRDSKLNPTPAVFRYLKIPGNAVAPDGSVYWSEFGSLHRYANGEQEHVAGGGTLGVNPYDGSPAEGVYLNAGPITFAANGDPVFYNGPTQEVYRLSSGVLHRIAVLTLEQRPRSIVTMSSGAMYFAADDGGLYRLDAGGNLAQIYRGFSPYSFSRLWLVGDGTLYARSTTFRSYRLRLDGSNPEEVNIPCANAATFAPNGDIYYSRNTIAGSGCQSTRSGLFVKRANSDETQEIKPLQPAVNPGRITLLPDGRLLFDEEDSRSVCGGLMTCTREIGGKFDEGLSSNTIVDPGTGLARRFSSVGKHTETRDAAGNSLWTMSYTADGRLSAVRDATGRETRIERDSSGVATAIVGPGGLRTELTIEDDQLKTIEAPGGLLHTFTYTENGLLKEYRNPRRFASTYLYDGSGRLEKASDAGTGSKTLTHERIDRTDKVTVTTASSQRTLYELTKIDETARIRKFTSPADRITTINDTAPSKTITAADGSVLALTYGSDPRPGSTSTIPTSVVLTLPSGITSRVTMTRAATFDANDPTSLKTLTDTYRVNNRTLTSTFTAASRTFRTTTAGGRVFERVFDATGQLTSATDPGTAPVTFSYDGLGRLQSVMQGTRHVTFGWNSEDQLTSTTDSLNRTVGITYGADGRAATVTLPGSRALTMTHDSNGNLLTLAHGTRAPHVFTYDARDLPSTTTPPGPDGAAHGLSYSFDSDRRLRSVTSGGRTVSVDYDTKGRVNAISDLVAHLSLSYDDNGRLTAISNPVGPSISYGWDGFLLARETWSGLVTGTVSWSYDNEVRVATQSVNGAAIAFGYDADSLLVSAGPLTLTRQPATGRISEVTTGAAAEQYAYNEYGEARDTNAKVAGVVVSSFTYTRDNAGRIASVTTSDGVTGYNYDESGRLAKVTRNGAIASEYDYDSNGNRRAHRWTGGSVDATFDDQDRLLAYGGATYTYRPDGSLLTKTLAGATTTYEYDAFGNLRSVSLPGDHTIEYVVDGANRRVGKKYDGVVVQRFLYSGTLQIVAELDDAGNVLSRFIYASRGNVPDAMIRDGVTYRIFSDHLGSPHLVVNAATGAIVQRMAYDEFGNVLSDTNPGFQPFGFAGGLYDRDTRLVRFGARDYDAHTGRWTCKEPLGFEGGDTNLYAYAWGDPVNYVDANGLQVAAANHPDYAKPPAPSTFAADPNDPRVSQIANGGTAPGFIFPRGTPPELQRECVALVRELSGAPCTRCWRQGARVMNNDTLPLFTAIASGWKADGTYPNGPQDKNLDRNSALYFGQISGGIRIIDQYPRDVNGNPHPGQRRPLTTAGSWPSNNASAYYTILAAPGCTCGN